MKKLVTIRKSPTGKGRFINKTQKFLEKAQMGQAVQPEYNQKVLEYVAEQILEKEEDPQIVYQTLIESKIDPETAQYHIEAIMEYQQNMQASQQQQPMSEEQLAEANPYSDEAAEVEQDLAGQYGYYDSSGVAQELAEDDSTDQGYDEDDPEDEDYMQDGGSINNYIMHNYLPAFTDSSAEDLDALQYAKGGAMDKRSFMRNVMRELKQAREGMQQEQNETFDRTDTLTLDRNKKKSDFVQALAKTTQEAKDKQAAEQQWQMQQQAMGKGQPQMPMMTKQEGGDNEHIYHHLAMMNESNQNMMSEPMNKTFTARDGFVMPSPREYRRMHRTVNRALPNIYLDPNIKHTNMNVTDTDWLGRPKQYTMDFQGQQGIMPNWMGGRLLIGLPGGANQGFSTNGGGGWNTSWGGSSYMNTKKGIKEVTKIKKDGIIRDINKSNDPQLHTKTSYDQDASGVPDNIQSDPLKVESTISPQYDVNQDNQLDVTQVSGVTTPTPQPGSGVLLPGNQFGGFVDPESDLYKFVYGGGDPAFDDYQNSINTADPYAGRMYRSGGFPKFGDGGQWITKANGETVWMTDDGKIDLNKKMTDDEKKIYDENVFKSHKDYYTQNKDKFADPAEQQKITDLQKQIQELQNQQRNYYQQGYNERYGQRLNPNYRYAPGQRSAGFLGSLLSADLAPNYLGTWTKVKGLKTSDGMPFTGFDDKTFLNKIEVNKSDWRNRPKAYTMHFTKSGIPINPAADANKNTSNTNKSNDSKPNLNKPDVINTISNFVNDNKNKQPGNAPGYEPNATGPGYSGYNADADGNKIPDYLEVKNPQDQFRSSDLSVNSGPINNQQPDQYQPNQNAIDYMKQSLTVGSNTNPSGSTVNNTSNNTNTTNTNTANRNSSGSGIASVYEPDPTTPNSYREPTGTPKFSREQFMTMPGGAGYQDFNQNNMIPDKPKYSAPVNFAPFANDIFANDMFGMQSGGYTEGGIAYMTADEMKQFLAAGGQIEFI